MKKYQTIMLSAALICGLHPAVADELEPFVIPLPPLPGVPNMELKLPAPPLLGELHNRLHEHIHDVVFAPIRFLAQVPPPATPALSVEPVKPVPAKPHASAKVAFEDDAFRFFNSASRPGRSLVIPKDDMNPETLAATEEDLNVMALILDKAVDERSGDDRKIMGIDVLTGSSSSSVRNLYIEGHGAIFLLRTKLALTPPTSKKEETKPKETTSSDWEDARRQLYGPNEWEKEIHKALKGVPGFSSSSAPYDEEKVNDLKTSVIDSLKNASNIRGLKGDHTVTVVVAGSGSGSVVGMSRREGDGKSERRVYAREEQGSGRRGSVMMIQAKKSDIDNFAKDGNPDSFRKKVKVHVY